MIVTVTLNPALDKTVELDRLVPGGLNRIKKVVTDAGGKGINVARVVAALGGRVLATGFLGGRIGDELVDRLLRAGIEHSFVQIDEATRTNTKVLETDGTLTELNEPGPKVSEDDWRRLDEVLSARAGEGALFALSGSLPFGAAQDSYRTMVERLHARGAAVFLDVDGAALKEALKAEPDYLKPNRHELLELFGAPPTEDIATLRAHCLRLVEGGVKLVALSMGAKGALFVGRRFAVRAPGLTVKAHSPVGAGDAMVGALCYALDEGLALDEGIRLAMAASAGAVATTGTKPPSGAAVRRLMAQVVLESLD